MTENTPPIDIICKCGHPESMHVKGMGCVFRDGIFCPCASFEQRYSNPSPTQQIITIPHGQTISTKPVIPQVIQPKKSNYKIGVRICKCGHKEVDHHVAFGCVYVDENKGCDCENFDLDNAPANQNAVERFSVEYSDGYYIEGNGKTISFEDAEDIKFVEWVCNTLNKALLSAKEL